MFSSWQAARRGGSCRGNVSLVLAHLDGAHSEPPTAFLGHDERQECGKPCLDRPLRHGRGAGRALNRPDA
eukprot:5447553-Alexandrium_andersonii.AAC.1